MYIRWSQALSRDTQWCNKRQWSWAGTQEVPPEPQEHSVLCVCAGALAQVPRGCVWGLLWRSSEAAQTWPGHLIWAALLLQRLGRLYSKVSANISHAVALWFCYYGKNLFSLQVILLSGLGLEEGERNKTLAYSFCVIQFHSHWVLKNGFIFKYYCHLEHSAPYVIR